MKKCLAWVRRYNLIWLGILIGAGFYVADVFIDVYLFNEGDILGQLLHPAPIEAWIRIIVLVLTTIFGVYAHVLLQRSRTAEQFFYTIIENIPDMVFIKEPKELRFVRLNHAGEKLLGYTREEFIGKNDYDFFPREQADYFIEKDRGVLESGTTLDIPEEEIDTRALGKRYLHTKKVPIKDSNGDSIFLLGISEDMTERRSAEIVLNDERERAEKYLQVSKAMIVSLDREGLITVINRRGCEILGYAEDQLLGKNWFEIALPEADRDKISEVFRAIMADNSELFADYENEVVRRDGEIRYIAWNNTLQRDENGEICGILSSGQDITRRKQAEDQLRLSATVFESSNQGILVTDKNNKTVSTNPAFSNITGYSFDEVRGKSPAYLQSGFHDEEFYQNLWRSINEQGYWKGEIWDRRKDGKSYPSWQTISAIRDEAGEITHYVSIFSDITPIKQQQASLDFLAHHDPLTGLPNRLMLDDRLEHAVQQHLRNHGQIAVFFIDLDDFKYVNDTFGHATGDRLLKAIADMLREMFRDEDTIARFGGDEFVILIQSFESQAALELIAEKIVNEVSETLNIEGNEITVATSVGIAVAPSGGTDPQTLLRSADKAMYQAKTMGRNRYHFYRHT